jgi:peptide/nickel transport system substrate-binding protein
MRTSKRLVGLVAIGAVSLLLATACGKSTSSTPQKSISLGECDTKPNECNSGPSKAGGTVIQVMEKKLVNWNINSAKGNILDITSVLNGVLPSAFIFYPDNTTHLNTDLMVSAEVTSKSPQTVVMKIQPNAAWDDGTPISADDFIYAWKTLNNKDCPDCDAAGTTGYDQMKSVTGSDNGKTVTIVFDTSFPDWQTLFTGLYPAHIATKFGNDGTATGLKKAWETFKTTQINFSGAAYKISDYQKDVSITLVPNDKFYGKTKAQLDKVIFRVIQDQAQQVPALKNKEVNLLQSQPSQAIVDQVRQIQGVDFAVTPGVAWEHVTVNMKNKFLADPALRKAIFTAINRKEVITKTLSFFDKAAPLGNHMLLPSQPGYKDNVTQFGYGDGKIDAAKKILTDAGYTVDPSGLKTKSGEAVAPLRFVYTKGNTPRQNAVELMQNQLKPLGITIKIDPTESLGDSLDNHDFDLIIFAFVGGPALTANIDLWKTNGGGNYPGYSDPKADEVLKQVATEFDPAKAADLLNQVDVMVSEAAADLPLFQKPNFLAVSHDFVNIRPNGTQFTSTYNIQEWASRATPAAK